MMFANRCTWAHLAASAAQLLGLDTGQLLNSAEAAALAGCGDPRVLR
jgi:hypothetical protein